MRCKEMNCEQCMKGTMFAIFNNGTVKSGYKSPDEIAFENPAPIMIGVYPGKDLPGDIEQLKKLSKFC
jgi:hypothetical protein